MKKIDYKPLGSRVILDLLPENKEELKQGGIELLSLPTRKAKVVSVGLGEYAPHTGQLIPTELKKGDTVLVMKDVPHLPLRINDHDYMLAREKDIECVVESVDE